MDPKIAKKTQDSLGKFIKKPPLTEKLLSKPPFRFLHDIMTSVIKTTGFMKGLYTDAEMVSENVKDKDAKVAFLQKAIDAVVAVTGKSLAVKPVKIVAGHEPERTNEFLQALAMAINANANNDEIVKKVLSGNSAVSKDGGDRDDRKDKGSAGRRKEPEDKVKKDDDDKQKSRERDKDKGRSDRRGDGDTAEKEKEKEHSRDRDRREKSRDREDRHRDKDVDKDRDRDKRKKTQVKSRGELLKDESPVAKESECSSMIHDVKEQHQTNKRSGDLFQEGTKLGSLGRNSLLGLHAASSLPQSVPQISRKPDQTSIRKQMVGADREGTKQGNLMSPASKHPSADFIPSQGDRHHLAQKGSSSNPTILVQDPRQTSKELKSSPTKSSVLPDHKLRIPPSSVIKFIKEEPKAQSSTKGKFDNKIPALRFPSRAPVSLTTSRPAVVNPIEPVHHIEKSKRTHGEGTAHGSKSSTNLQEFHLTSEKAAESPPTKHIEMDEKENESPEQNGEKEQAQETPAKLQRPTSAKGSRRRRQGRESRDDEDEEFQHRGADESQEQAPGEEDLPPQIAAARKVARPSSARPAPPRPKQDAVEAEPSMRLGNAAPANLIVDNGQQSDEDENFLVEEAAPPPVRVEPVLAKPEEEDDAEHGALVKKMLESKKESQLQRPQAAKKTEIERPAMSDTQRRKQREMVSKEIERLQTSIQSLTRSANPLGKIMDYLQEDLDSMQKELDRWRSENKEHALALRRERNVTDRAVEPLKAQLADLERAIADQLDLIAATKSSIMRNDSRIDKMLRSLSRS